MHSRVPHPHPHPPTSVQMSLIPIDDVGTTRSYDYTDATLIQPGRYTARSPMTSSSFAKTFFTHFPSLQKMDWANVAVRGGAVVDILLGQTPTDLDIFLYGCSTPEGFVERANKLIGFLLESERRAVEARNEAAKKAAEEAMKSGGYYPGRWQHHQAQAPVEEINIKACRQGPVVTIYSGNVKVPLQIVLTSYDTLGSVVAGADIPVCGASFDGTTVFVNAEGKWSLENLAIRVRDGFFPRAMRLQKYFMKGFDIVLPGLDVAKLPVDYIKIGGLLDAFQTPCLTVAYSSVHKNKISVASFLNVEDAPNAVLGHPVYEDASGGGGRMTFPEAPESRAVLYMNMEKLAAATALGDDSDAAPPSFNVFAEADFVADCLQPWPQLTPRQVENTLDGVGATLFQGGQLNFGKWQQFIHAVPLQKLIAKVVAACPEGEGVHAACQEAVEVAVEAQKAACNALLPKVAAYFEGKLPPVITPEETFLYKLEKDPAKFYGRFLKEAGGGGA